jgi:hypothetical protein
LLLGLGDTWQPGGRLLVPLAASGSAANNKRICKVVGTLHAG